MVMQTITDQRKRAQELPLDQLRHAQAALELEVLFDAEHWPPGAPRPGMERLLELGQELLVRSGSGIA
jgi:hypothetical protein